VSGIASVPVPFRDIEYNYLPTQYANYRKTPDEVIYRHLGRARFRDGQGWEFAFSLPNETMRS